MTSLSMDGSFKPSASANLGGTMILTGAFREGFLLCLLLLAISADACVPVLHPELFAVPPTVSAHHRICLVFSPGGNSISHLFVLAFAWTACSVLLHGNPPHAPFAI